MSNQNRKRISAVRFIRKLHDSSRSVLVEASNGLEYVVKWLLNPKSATAIHTEALGASIYEEFGLPVPSWAPIEVSNDFVDANPSMWFELQGGTAKPRSGFHFASRSLDVDTCRVFETVPESWHSRIQNRSDFWGALAIDVWLDSCHSRHALFVEDDQASKLTAFFISHGHIQAGLNGQQRKSFRPYLYPDRRIYAATEMKAALGSWVEQIETRGSAVFLTVLRNLEVDVTKPFVRDFTERVLTRARSLRRTVSAMEAEFADAHGKKPARSVHPPAFSTAACDSLTAGRACSTL